jgi:uncharacterized protein (TIGR04255 family)
MSTKSETHSSANKTSIPDRRYKKPPAVEALCEIYFSGSAWDDTVPGAFYERIKNDFPQKRQRKIQEAQVTLGPEQAVAGVRELPPWMQFVSDEKQRMIQIARDLLVVNQLHPYPHFEEWEPDVYKCLRIYRELAQPEKIARVGLRYINRVVIPEERVRMEEYFAIYPNLPQRLGDTHGPFLVRVEVPQLEGHTVLVTFGTAPVPPGANQPAQAFMLDFYDLLQMDQSVDEQALSKEINRAHDNLVLAFEDSITDRLRELFELKEK